jgi:hypothetical protein
MIPKINKPDNYHTLKNPSNKIKNIFYFYLYLDMGLKLKIVPDS